MILLFTNVYWGPQCVGPWGRRWLLVSAFKELIDRRWGLESGLAKNRFQEVLLRGLPDCFLWGLNDCLLSMHEHIMAFARGTGCGLLASQHPCEEQCLTPITLSALSVILLPVASSLRVKLTGPGETHSHWMSNTWSQGARGLPWWLRW